MIDQEMLDAVQGLLSQQKQDILSEMTQQKKDILGEMDLKLAEQKQDILGEMDLKLAGQKQDILGEMAQQKQDILGEMDLKLVKQKRETVSECTNNMMVLIESDIMPKFNLLAEGQQTIRELMVPRSRVEDLEDEVKFMKAMMHQMNEKILDLQKAQ